MDDSGDVYITGLASTDFPTTPGAFQTTLKGSSDAFVTKFNPTGSALVYSTYLGGNGDDYGEGVAVDNVGNAYVMGISRSYNFPTTVGAFQTKCNGVNRKECRKFGDAFVTKIDVRPDTTTVISSSPNPSKYGQAVAFTATVTSSVGAPPNGETVTFMKGKTVLGTGTLNVAWPPLRPRR